ncbi:MAG: hypothetical protein M1816_005686 [Peltula sp. TS41687]|nr:MAG: hypothetical protein M1816_005686 [Peltula sp. TS41687]
MGLSRNGIYGYGYTTTTTPATITNPENIVIGDANRHNETRGQDGDDGVQQHPTMSVAELAHYLGRLHTLDQTAPGAIPLEIQHQTTRTQQTDQNLRALLHSLITTTQHHSSSRAAAASSLGITSPPSSSETETESDSSMSVSMSMSTDEDEEENGDDLLESWNEQRRRLLVDALGAARRGRGPLGVGGSGGVREGKDGKSGVVGVGGVCVAECLSSKRTSVKKAVRMRRRAG